VPEVGDLRFAPDRLNATFALPYIASVRAVDKKYFPNPATREAA